ncbi:MAG: DUF6249 domain-containing protein [Prevotellaceae bacterium]|nr:DUF6249 domain-containing protein [Prevotellaceae bacterium]
MKQFIWAFSLALMLAAFLLPTAKATCVSSISSTTAAIYADIGHHPGTAEQALAEQALNMVSDQQASQTIIALTAIAFGCGVPLIIIFVIFYFRYKNRKAQYRLAEQAIANGQLLPPDFFKQADMEKSMFNKGIQNVFTGIGLFIFLWAIIDFTIGAIGLLVMFMGFGQLVIYYTAQKK